MSSSRRLASLNLVHRVRAHELEAIGAELSAIRTQQAGITAEQEALTKQAHFECTNATAESYAFLSGYLKSVERRQQQLEEQSCALDEQATVFEEQLLTAFRDVKTNDAVKGQTMQEIQQGIERNEMLELDDANRALYLLKQSNRL